MSPERRLDATVIENDAQHITNFLLGIEAKAEAARQDLLDYELKDIRQKLDYTPVDTASSNNLVDTRILEKTPVITPYSLEKVIPVSPVSEETTQKSRFNIEQIITDEDDRLLVIIGPCSIHDPETALEFAEWALEMREKFGETLEIVMRAYFEKPRTELGWKGFINDSELDDSCDMNLGIVKSRMLACQITNAGVPIATERLNALTPQFFNGLIAYDTIGARNTSDQKAREYASGTSSPVGFKNTTEGSIKTATEAVVAAELRILS